MHKLLNVGGMFMKIGRMKKSIRGCTFGFFRDISFVFDTYNTNMTIKIKNSILNNITNAGYYNVAIEFPSQYFNLTFQQFKIISDLIQNTTLDKFTLQHPKRRFRVNNIELPNLTNYEKLLFIGCRKFVDYLEFNSGIRFNPYPQIKNQIPEEFISEIISYSPNNIPADNTGIRYIYLQLYEYNHTIVKKNMDFKEIYNLIKQCV